MNFLFSGKNEIQLGHGILIFGAEYQANAFDYKINTCVPFSVCEAGKPRVRNQKLKLHVHVTIGYNNNI